MSDYWCSCYIVCTDVLAREACILDMAAWAVNGFIKLKRVVGEG